MLASLARKLRELAMGNGIIWGGGMEEHVGDGNCIPLGGTSKFIPVSLATELRELAMDDGIICEGGFEERVADRF